MNGERVERTYRFDPLDRSGIFLGLGLIQCALLGGGLVLAVLAVTAGLPIPVAAIPALAGATASFARAGGYPAWEWLPLGASWLALRFGCGARWYAPLPLLATDDRTPPPALPPCLAGLDIVEIGWRGSTCIGAISDRQRQSLTALIPAKGTAFLTQPRVEQEALLASWGDVLAQLASESSAVTHAGWSATTRRAGIAEHARWLASTQRGTPNTAAERSYEALIEQASDEVSTQEVLIFVTVTGQRPSRRSAPSDPDATSGRALGSAVESLQRGLHTAGITAADPLSAAQVRHLLRTRIDPFSVRPTITNGRLVERLGLVSPAAAGPLAMDTTWRETRIDGAWHRTYWVASFPRLPQHPSWLEPLLSTQRACRTMTVFLQPVSAYQSRRRIERDLVKLDSDAHTKEEKGRRVDARHRRVTQALLDREQELVAGYAEMAYNAVICVSAPDLAELDEDCEVIEQNAREVGLELKVIDGRQDLAWACSLPFGLNPKHLLT